MSDARQNETDERDHRIALEFEKRLVDAELYTAKSLDSWSLAFSGSTLAVPLAVIFADKGIVVYTPKVITASVACLGLAVVFGMLSKVIAAIWISHCLQVVENEIRSSQIRPMDAVRSRLDKKRSLVNRMNFWLNIITYVLFVVGFACVLVSAIVSLNKLVELKEMIP